MIIIFDINLTDLSKVDLNRLEVFSRVQGVGACLQIIIISKISSLVSHYYNH